MLLCQMGNVRRLFPTANVTAQRMTPFGWLPFPRCRRCMQLACSGSWHVRFETDRRVALRTFQPFGPLIHLAVPSDKNSSASLLHEAVGEKTNTKSSSNDHMEVQVASSSQSVHSLCHIPQNPLLSPYITDTIRLYFLYKHAFIYAYSGILGLCKPPCYFAARPQQLCEGPLSEASGQRSRAVSCRGSRQRHFGGSTSCSFNVWESKSL